jgi:hypothetical protein
VTILLMAMVLHFYGLYSRGVAVSLEARLWLQSPTIALSALFCMQAFRRNPLSFSLRVASWLPLIHLGLLALVTAFWFGMLNEDRYLAKHFSLLDSASFGAVALAICSVFLVALLIHGIRSEGRRQLACLYPIAISLLIFTLLLGLWLPIAAERWIPFELPVWSTDTLAFHDRFLWLALLPPASATLLLTALLTPARARGFVSSSTFKLVAGSGLLVLLIIAVAARTNSDVPSIVAYLNLVPLLLCSAFLFMIAVLAIALSHWLALRGARRQESSTIGTQEGEVIPQAGTESAARLYNLGWFLGLRTQCDAFVLRTAAGDLPIPAGARLIAPLPLWTSRSRCGDSSPILRGGDRVRATGFVAPPGDNPFRRSEMPLPGSRGIVVVKASADEANLWRELALVLWRPALLYVAVISLVALPGLAGFFAL